MCNEMQNKGRKKQARSSYKQQQSKATQPMYMYMLFRQKKFLPLSLFQPNNYRQWIRVEFHVSLLGHALSAVDLCDAARQVSPDVLQVHRLHAVWVVRTATHGRRWVRVVAGERGGGWMIQYQHRHNTLAHPVV